MYLKIENFTMWIAAEAPGIMSKACLEMEEYFQSDDDDLTFAAEQAIRDNKTKSLISFTAGYYGVRSDFKKYITDLTKRIKGVAIKLAWSDDNLWGTDKAPYFELVSCGGQTKIKTVEWEDEELPELLK